MKGKALSKLEKAKKQVDEEEKSEKEPPFTHKIIDGLNYSKGQVPEIFRKKKESPILNKVKKVLQSKDSKKKGILIEKDDKLIGVAVLAFSEDWSDFLNGQAWEFNLVCTTPLFSELPDGDNELVSDSDDLNRSLEKLSRDLKLCEEVEQIVVDKQSPGTKFNVRFLKPMSNRNVVTISSCKECFVVNL